MEAFPARRSSRPPPPGPTAWSPAPPSSAPRTAPPLSGSSSRKPEPRTNLSSARLKEKHMAVVIRLQRIGKPHQPYYRIVTIEKTRGATGKPVEVIGSYNPREESAGKKVVLKQDRY